MLAHDLIYRTSGGVTITRTVHPLPVADATRDLIDRLDAHPGVLLASSYEYPGRYTRRDLGFSDPPLVLSARERTFELRALNDRGSVLLPGIQERLSGSSAIATLTAQPERLIGSIHAPGGRFSEEERSKQPSIFSVLRSLLGLFASDQDAELGLYGAFAYDLAFQFEDIARHLPRPEGKRDLVLYLPDRLIVVDHRLQLAARLDYDFELAGASTAGLPRRTPAVPYRAAEVLPERPGLERRDRDHAPGAFARLVTEAHAWFKRGDLFEAVPGQCFYELCPAPPSEVFRRLRERNPAPYGAFMNLGESEYLVGASPEMYVRSEGRRIETCPISGTIARGSDAIGDAEQILKLLSSSKEASELTMCTDVDRNDKARVCEPGSIRVIGRRQIEMYSRLIHTVDHVEGLLRDGFDALDAFLSHAWAVTVTGAPKLWAMRFIEEHERSFRAWYGGAIGMLGFNGDINTGLTLRTMRIKDGVAEVRVGATLLYDADPASEEAETELKASALIDAVRRPRTAPAAIARAGSGIGRGRRILLLDHEDSFVHTLADYLRQTGAEVATCRVPPTAEGLQDELRRRRPSLVVLSPGPGTPSDFQVPRSLGICLGLGIPVFGVCLGLQGMVEHFGGRLGVLDHPMHGKPSTITVTGGRLFQGLPTSFVAGRYHSLYALPAALPEVLEVSAMSSDGVIMAVEHRSLPCAAVQFHPESIMSLQEAVGNRLIEQVVRQLALPAESAGAQA